MIAWLKCFFLGHDWERRSHPKEEGIHTRAFWEDWHVCRRCHEDSRKIWEIEDDNQIRMERIEMEMRARKL